MLSRMLFEQLFAVSKEHLFQEIGFQQLDSHTVTSLRICGRKFVHAAYTR